MTEAEKGQPIFTSETPKDLKHQKLNRTQAIELNAREQAKNRIAEENRKRAEREADPREKKKRKTAPKFCVEYRKKSEPVYK